MLFHSYTFMLVFLPLAWLGFAAVRQISWRLGGAVIALASLFFYAYWDVRFLPLLVGSILANFLIGRRIETSVDPSRRRWMVFGVALNLGFLGFFKYADFFLSNLSAVSGQTFEPLAIVLPIGISFFTFQQIAYLVDVAEGRSDRYRLSDYTVFVAFFPQLIAGPIVHHREMMPQFIANRGPRAYDIALGLSIFVAGLFKKTVIADNLAQFASPVFAAADAGGGISMAEAWGAALAYTFQIYFDFSGYSDMAIGLARLFGIRLPINFNSPYKASSIIDFWRRWHMTLSRFLRDYLYIRLGGNRLGPGRRQINLMATMLLGGLWHGAGWGFVIWGGLHGAYLAINHWARNAARRHPPMRVLCNRWLAGCVTFLAVVFAWLFFRATTLEGAVAMAKAMLAVEGLSVPVDFRAQLGALAGFPGLEFAHPSQVELRDWALEGVPLILIAGALCWLAPNTNQVFLWGDTFYSRQLDPQPAPRLRWDPTIPAACAVSVCFVAAVLYASTISEFLYFQF